MINPRSPGPKTQTSPSNVGGVNRSTHSSHLVPGDGVLPGGLVGGHGAVYHVDEVALEDSRAPRAPFLYSWRASSC